jgi:hypothetical protein
MNRAIDDGECTRQVGQLDFVADIGYAGIDRLKDMERPIERKYNTFVDGQ